MFIQRPKTFTKMTGSFVLIAGVVGGSAASKLNASQSAISKRVQLETGFANLVDVNYAHSKTTTVNNNVTSADKWNSFNISTSLSNEFGFAVGIKVLLGS